MAPDLRFMGQMFSSVPLLPIVAARVTSTISLTYAPAYASRILAFSARAPDARLNSVPSGAYVDTHTPQDTRPLRGGCKEKTQMSEEKVSKKSVVAHETRPLGRRTMPFLVVESPHMTIQVSLTAALSSLNVAIDGTTHEQFSCEHTTAPSKSARVSLAQLSGNLFTALKCRGILSKRAKGIRNIAHTRCYASRWCL